MRTALIWTLSILLGFEPALFAAGKNPNSEIKAFLETSQITQRSMTIKDLFAKTSASLPESVRVDLETFVSKQGNVLIPKFDVNKVSGPNGEGLYQIQAVQDGQAISMTFVLGKEVFMKVNGTNYTWNEMNDVRQVMAKAGLGPKEIQENFPSRKPANAAKFLSADQILKLNPEQKKLYFKQFRDLLESMEAVENALSNKTTSSRENGRAKTFAQQMVQLFLGEEVKADDGRASLGKTYCFFAGYVIDSQGEKVVDASGTPLRSGQVCSSLSSGKIPDIFRKQENGDPCGGGSYACNPVVYGPGGGCVPAGLETTKNCNEKVKGKGKDIPDFYWKNKELFNHLKNKAEAAAKDLNDKCESQHTVDAACSNFALRLAEIQSWDCRLKVFSDKYPLLCKDPSFRAPVDSGLGLPNCGVEPAEKELSFEKGSCQSTKSRGEAEGSLRSCYNLLGELTSESVYKCVCKDGGIIIGKMLCDGGKAAKLFSDDKKFEKKKGPNWPVIAVVGTLFFFGGRYMYRAIVNAPKDAYQQVVPSAQVPGITVPSLPTIVSPPTPQAPVNKSGPGVR